jgi:hypothetical protein
LRKRDGVASVLVALVDLADESVPDMSMSPTLRLIIGEAALTFAMFETALDPIAMPLYLRQP